MLDIKDQAYVEILFQLFYSVHEVDQLKSPQESISEKKFFKSKIQLISETMIPENREKFLKLPYEKKRSFVIWLMKMAILL